MVGNKVILGVCMVQQSVTEMHIYLHAMLGDILSHYAQFNALH